MDKVTYTEKYTEDAYSVLLDELDWISTGAPREEYFMSLVPLEYTYGYGLGQRSYLSSAFHPVVKSLMDKLNTDFDCEYNICFLNYYTGQRKWLGWHSDDSPEMDHDHPIAVISFGEERDINWKPIGHKGEIPDEWKQKLGCGSLFVMGAGFQQTHQHKIPKHFSLECSGRISLTFRKYKA